MSEPRIRVPKDKQDWIDKLVGTDNGSYPAFSHRVDVLAFCAAFGFKQANRVPFKDTTNDIRFTVFENRGHDVVFNILALAETNDPTILSNAIESKKNRNLIFEEYANGGLEILQEQLKSQVEYLQNFLLIMQQSVNP